MRLVKMLFYCISTSTLARRYESLHREALGSPDIEIDPPGEM